MTKREETESAAKTAAGENAILNNTIRSPLGSKDDDNLQVIFHSYIPKTVMFATYGATCTVNVSLSNGPAKPYKVGPGVMPQIPTEGASSVYAEVTDVMVLDPTMASLCTTFD